MAIFGDNNDNALPGTAGNDDIFGLGGNDLIRALQGNDTVRGGIGDDTVYGGFGDDFIMGDLGNDVLNGGFGDDTLDGGFGKDVLLGGAGLDRINGYGRVASAIAQVDVLNGGANSDTFVLGGFWGTSYSVAGDLDYALIQGWEAIDFIEVNGTAANISSVPGFFGVGDPLVPDRAIIFTDLLGVGDRIAILEDVVAVPNYIFV